jgi:hypothetical protein
MTYCTSCTVATTCLACSAGYSGQTCGACDVGYLQTSAGPPIVCGACTIANCDDCTGDQAACVACALGWALPDCDVCATGFVGAGTCDTCDTGYDGDSCETCDTTHYDSDPSAALICTICTDPMPHCLACTVFDSCTDCDDGYKVLRADNALPDSLTQTAAPLLTASAA